MLLFLQKYLYDKALPLYLGVISDQRMEAIEMVEGHDPLVEKVRNYFASSTSKGMKELAELAPGVVCVNAKRGGVGLYSDSRVRWDTYFDMSRWEVRDEAAGNDSCPPGLQGTDVRELSIYPPVENFDGALEFAKTQLKPRNQQTSWYESPKILIFLREFN